MTGAIERGAFRMAATGTQANPYWVIPERMPLSRLMTVTGFLTCSASAQNRYLRLSVFDQQSIKVAEFVSNTLLVANDTVRFTFQAGGMGAEISQANVLHLGIGAQILMPGDSVQIFGTHATDEVSDAMLTLLVEPMI